MNVQCMMIERKAMKKIVVVGSANVDLVTNTPSFPAPGQTVTGTAFHISMGGKGANQAVASALLGADVCFLGMVGNDSFGEMMLASLNRAGVDTRATERAETATGTAAILVNRDAENMIVCTPGANAFVDTDYVRRHIDLLDASDIVLVQLEIPIETVLWVCRYAKSNGKTVILDPAPSNHFTEELLDACTVITPNESELHEIVGEKVDSFERFKELSKKLTSNGAQVIINKRGSDGAFVCAEGRYANIPTHRVKAVDTTAAGDCFNGALAFGLSNGIALEECIAFANAAAALSVTRPGAQSSMPSADEVSQFLKDKTRA